MRATSAFSGSCSVEQPFLLVIIEHVTEHLPDMHGLNFGEITEPACMRAYFNHFEGLALNDTKGIDGLTPFLIYFSY